MFSRRQFLTRSSLFALAPCVPQLVVDAARRLTPGSDDRLLIVIELEGGNDGLGTVVPFGHDVYEKSRPTLARKKQDLGLIDDRFGLHPSLRPWHELLQDQSLSILHGVGYPESSRSHFRARAVWHSARTSPLEHKTEIGWLGRALDGEKPETARSLFIGQESPAIALRGRRARASSLTNLEDYSLLGVHQEGAARDVKSDLESFASKSFSDALRTAESLNQLKAAKSEVAYPDTKLASRFELMATLIKANLGPRVFYATQDGYDTHATQNLGHAELLRDLATSVKAFMDDLRRTKLDDRVLLFVFSEFGRTIKENGSAGTDHGTAAPVFLIGKGVQPGLHGTFPDLTDLADNEPKPTVDFRRVYATLIESWLGLESRVSVGEDYKPLPDLLIPG